MNEIARSTHHPRATTQAADHERVRGYLQTRIHLCPSGTGYTAITNHTPSEPLIPRQLPSLTLRLSGLGLD